MGLITFTHNEIVYQGKNSRSGFVFFFWIPSGDISIKMELCLRRDFEQINKKQSVFFSMDSLTKMHVWQGQRWLSSPLVWALRKGRCLRSLTEGMSCLPGDWDCSHSQPVTKAPSTGVWGSGSFFSMRVICGCFPHTIRALRWGVTRKVYKQKSRNLSLLWKHKLQNRPTSKEILSQ